ncbi:MAG: DUF177 domain-containing protein [Novosphingobium sp.]|nr:DUF177 domain-containing protein [Novosphingobium sp.]
MTPEFSRLIDIRHLPERAMRFEADANERAALARRFGIEAIVRLEAEVALERAGDTVVANGRIEADIVQACAVSGDPFPTRLNEAVALRFVHGAVDPLADIDIELDPEGCDEIPFEGTQFDLGEAIAQTLALAIDPYATGPDADRVRREARLGDERASGPFAALAALKK